jgi:hypothetical protein
LKDLFEKKMCLYYNMEFKVFLDYLLKYVGVLLILYLSTKKYTKPIYLPLLCIIVILILAVISSILNKNVSESFTSNVETDYDDSENRKTRIENGSFSKGGDLVNLISKEAGNEIVTIPNPGLTSYALQQTATEDGQNLYHVNLKLSTDKKYKFSCWAFHDMEWDGNRDIFNIKVWKNTTPHLNYISKGSVVETRDMDGNMWERLEFIIDIPTDSNGHVDWYIGLNAGNTKEFRYITDIEVQKYYASVGKLPVTDGLECYLQAKDANSFDGVGNVWKDLSGHGRDWMWDKTPKRNEFGFEISKPAILTGPSSNKLGITNKKGKGGYTVIIHYKQDEQRGGSYSQNLNLKMYTSNSDIPYVGFNHYGKAKSKNDLTSLKASMFSKNRRHGGQTVNNQLDLRSLDNRNLQTVMTQVINEQTIIGYLDDNKVAHWKDRLDLMTNFEFNDQNAEMSFGDGAPKTELYGILMYSRELSQEEIGKVTRYLNYYVNKDSTFESFKNPPQQLQRQYEPPSMVETFFGKFLPNKQQNQQYQTGSSNKQFEHFAVQDSDSKKNNSNTIIIRDGDRPSGDNVNIDIMSNDVNGTYELSDLYKKRGELTAQLDKNRLAFDAKINNYMSQLRSCKNESQQESLSERSILARNEKQAFITNMNVEIANIQASIDRLKQVNETNAGMNADNATQYDANQQTQTNNVEFTSQPNVNGMLVTAQLINPQGEVVQNASYDDEYVGNRNQGNMLNINENNVNDAIINGGGVPESDIEKQTGSFVLGLLKSFGNSMFEDVSNGENPLKSGVDNIKSVINQIEGNPQQQECNKVKSGGFSTISALNPQDYQKLTSAQKARVLDDSLFNRTVREDEEPEITDEQIENYVRRSGKYFTQKDIASCNGCSFPKEKCKNPE